MMEKKSISRNFIFQFLYQGIILVIPFILSPYLTRTLHETALGTYTYVNSIAYYFVIAANLGIGVHGKRAIARVSDNPTALRKTFWSLYSAHALISTITTIIYICFIGFFIQNDKIIYIIEIMYLLSAVFDTTWLFYGLENFQSIVIKNAIVKVLECVFIFTLVHEPSDIFIYTIICAGGILLSQLALFTEAVIKIKPIKIIFEDVKEHFKPMLVFSVALIASSLYTVFDKTLLGLLSTKENVAYYEYSEKIIGIPRTFMEVISTVLFPTACRLVAEGKKTELKKYINRSFFAMAFLGMGAIFGLAAISGEFVRIYYGESFAACGGVIIALSPVIYIIGTGKIIRSQYMIPCGMDKEFNLSIVYNAILNLILSTALIPVLGIYGAVIGTVAAECLGLGYQMYICRKELKYEAIIKSLVPFTIIGLIMFFAIKLIPAIGGDISTLIFKIIIGIIIYSGMSIIYLYKFRRDELCFILNIIRRKKNEQD